MTSVNEMNAVMRERARLREEVVKLMKPVSEWDLEVQDLDELQNTARNAALADVLALLRD